MTAAMTARGDVFLVDDHAGIRTALASFVAKEFDVIGAAGSAEEALAADNIAAADVVLVDVSLPRTSGIDLVDLLRKRHPELRCLMLSGHDSLSYVKRSLAAGARGYLTKDDPVEILEGIRSVIAGKVFIAHKFRAALAAENGERPCDTRAE